MTTKTNGSSQHNQGSSVIKWEAYSLADAYKERPPVEYIAGNLFEIPSVSIVYGAPGSLKSLLLADLAACVVGGKDWLPPLQDPSGRGMAVTQTPVIWLDFDNGERRTLDRFKAIGLTLGLLSDAQLHVYTMPDPILEASDDTHMSELAEIVSGKHARLVIIDNLAMISGDLDENSNDMGSVLHNLRMLSEITGAAIVVIHHARKASSSIRKGDTLRGHSSIEGAIDLALFIERVGKSPNISLEATKVRGSEVKPFTALFDFEDDENGNLRKAKFYSTSGHTSIDKRQIMKAILEVIEGTEMKKTNLVKEVQKYLQEQCNIKAGLKIITENIEEMDQAGYLLRKEGKNNAQIFSRNPDKSLPW